MIEKNNGANNKCSDPTAALRSPPCSSLIPGAVKVEAEGQQEERTSGVGDSPLEVDDSTLKMEEMEAAEALAGLAHWGVSVCQSEPWSAESGGKWGSKGKRASQRRVKTQSRPQDPGLHTPNDSPPVSSDLAEGLKISEQTCKTIVIKPVKAGQDIKLPKPLSTFTFNNASCGVGKSKQNRTEAEKEARRLRRVLANRESARQTIRRRQALCEELTRKAADLEWENVNLRKEKELAMKEYQSLKNTNECLKAQVAETIKPKVEETPGDFISSLNYHLAKTIKAELEEAPKYTNYVPSVSQRGAQNGTTLSSEVAVLASGGWPRLSLEESNFMNSNGSNIPFYILPSPWFFHLPEIKRELYTQQPIIPNYKQDETFTSNNPTASFVKTIPRIDDPLQSLPVNIKEEASSESTNKLQDAQYGLPRYADGLHTESQPRGMVLLPFPCNSLRPSVYARRENGIQADCKQVISSAEGHAVRTSIENTRELSTGPSKKLVGVIAAAEARKRRRELTKLKNLHGHQCRIRS